MQVINNQLSDYAQQHTHQLVLIKHGLTPFHKYAFYELSSSMSCASPIFSETILLLISLTLLKFVLFVINNKLKDLKVGKDGR